MGGNIIMKLKEILKIHVGQLLVPLEIIMSKIYLKYLLIHIHSIHITILSIPA